MDSRRTEATAPVTYGHTVAVSNWSVYTLPQHRLEAILAHELAHHLALPRLVSLFLYCLSLPARTMGYVITNGLKHRILRIVVRPWIVVLTFGVFVLGYVTQFDYVTVMMLSAWARVAAGTVAVAQGRTAHRPDGIRSRLRHPAGRGLREP
ncbi:hypothetical protein [Kribbella catacumbae]|uniref:hypothetical protein n=1 Tax=Kribbella catacumbae TaxID=460086 RepID=UPI0003A1A2BB|nr:hypothetical protein [Kribbella catacumbae]